MVTQLSLSRGRWLRLIQGITCSPARRAKVTIHRIILSPALAGQPVTCFQDPLCIRGVMASLCSLIGWKLGWEFGYLFGERLSEQI